MQVYKYIAKMNAFKQHICHPNVFPRLHAMHHTLAPALFNSNIKGKQIRHVPKCKSKTFLTFTINHLLLSRHMWRVKYAEKINNIESINFQIQQSARNYSQYFTTNTTRTRLLLCLHGTIVGSDALSSWAEAQSSNISTAVVWF